MQAIARVNRTFRDKPGGLIVDYIGIASNLQQALAEYSPTDRDQAGVPIEEMVAAMLEKHDIIRGLLHGCDFDARPAPARRRAPGRSTRPCSTSCMADPDRTERFLDQVLALAKAFALCGARDEAARDPQRRAAVHRRPRRHPQDPEPGLRSRRQRGRCRDRHRDRPARQRGRRRRRGRRHLQAGRHRDAGAVDPVGRVPRRPRSQGQAEPADGPAAPLCSTIRSGPCSAPISSRPASSPSSSTKRSTATPTAR